VWAKRDILSCEERVVEVSMDRPQVVIFGEVSLDGRLTLAPDVLLLFETEKWRAIAGESPVYEWIRTVYRPQAYLEGSRSLVKSDQRPEPLPPADGEVGGLYEDYLPEEVITHPDRRGWFVNVDSRGMIRWLYKEWPEESWAGWHLLVLVSAGTPAEYLAYLRREMIPYLVTGVDRVDLGQALVKLKDKLGIERVLSTSPGKLGGALLRAGLVDEINLEFIPVVIGGYRTPTLFESPELGPDEWPTRLKMVSACSQAGGRVWLRYQVLGGEGPAE
jgi:2,5-diamino-6-(ribosylamino)-4(3H)-pyrimidinone 5'-phosphate reductase